MQNMQKKNIIYLAAAVAAALIIFVIALISINSGDDEIYTEYYNEALLSFAEGDYDEAASLLRKAADIDDKPDCMLLLAECYGRMGNYDKALTILRKISVKDSTVSNKILEFEDKKAAELNAGRIDIAGKTYKTTETEFVRNNAGLTSGDLSNLSSLFSLSNVSLKNNDITDLSFLTSLKGITSLNLTNNAVSDIRPLENLTSLRTLYLDGNPVSDLSPLYKLSGLTFLSIKNIQAGDSQLAALSNALPSCTIHSENSGDDGDVTEISIGGLQFNTEVTELDLSGRSISDISALSACKKLRTLNISDNNIEDITPLMDIPALMSVDMSRNSISDIRPLMGLNTLQHIDAGYNNIRNVAGLYTLSNLEELYLKANSIEDVSPLTRLRGLKYLDLSDNELTDDSLTDLTYMSSLKFLDITGNDELTGKNIGMLLKTLSACSISHSDIVETVTVDGIEYLQDEASVDFSHMGLEDISFIAEFTSLESVNLAHNSVENIYVFGTMEDRLTSLNLSDNRISDLSPLARHYSLTSLDLSNNNIKGISPLLGLSNLTELYLSGNELTQEEINVLTEALPGCMIYF